MIPKKACPGLDPGWDPAFGKDHAQTNDSGVVLRMAPKESGPVKASNGPYALPHTLERDLARVYTFWEGLKRHEAEMPFWDDVKISALPDLAGRLMMIEATDKPVRFRIAFGLVGADIKQHYGHDLSGKFLDEIDAAAPLQFLVSQCCATVESRAPTYYRNDGAEGYSRLVLPLWGDSRIGMLLVAYAFA
jgi:hypothetical protein